MCVADQYDERSNAEDQRRARLFHRDLLGAEELPIQDLEHVQLTAERQRADRRTDAVPQFVQEQPLNEPVREQIDQPGQPAVQ